MTRNFVFLLASTRADGNSERLARHAARGATAQWLRLVEHPLPPFADTRHMAMQWRGALLGHANRYFTDGRE